MMEGRMELEIRLNRADTRWLVQRMLETGEERLGKFQKNLQDDPTRAFEWGQDSVKGGAKREVAHRVLAMLDNPELPLEGIVQQILQNALRGATYPRESTSTLSNLLDVYITAAYAELAKELLGF